MAMFGIELVIPLCLFGPRRLRLWGVGVMVFFQVLILPNSTGLHFPAASLRGSPPAPAPQ